MQECGRVWQPEVDNERRGEMKVAHWHSGRELTALERGDNSLREAAARRRLHSGYS